MVIREACPACGAKRYKKNGHTRHGKQKHQCQACERQFVATADNRLITPAQRTLIEHLLCERLSLRGSCRAVGRIGSLKGILPRRYHRSPLARLRRRPLLARGEGGVPSTQRRHAAAARSKDWRGFVRSGQAAQDA